MAEDTINDQDIAELIAWLRTRPWLTQGGLAATFERRWSDWLGTAYSTFVNSGSSANLLAYYALLMSGTLRNRKVVVPAVAWSTTVAPAIQLGFEPIPCDAEPTTFGLDIEQLDELCRRHRPGAVIVVHVLGVPCDLAGVLELKERYGFALIEDACAATGSRYDRRKVGTFGDLATFSFFFGHHVSTIEGGMVCTFDEELHDILLQIRAHGWARDLPGHKEAERATRSGIPGFNRPFTFYYPGFNVRSTDLNARIGLSQLDRIDEIVGRRAENHRKYASRFSASPVSRCQRNDRAEISSIAFAVLAESDGHRQHIGRALHRAGIETRPVGGGNMTRQPFWRDRLEVIAHPVADRIHDTAFQLPNHPGLDAAAIDFICDTVLEA